MKIVIIGGTGLIGKRLVKLLREGGHEAVPASPSTGINSVTGAGLAEAMTGAHGVVDVTNAPSWEDAAVITTMRVYFRSLKIVLLFVILAFILTSVVYFGASSFSGDTPEGAVATVNGERIGRERFRRAYNNYLEFYRQIYKERLTPEMAEQLGLTQRVVDGLVQETLIVQQAEREGLRVSDEEVRARIQTIPAFQVDGRFARERYLAVLKQVRIEPGEFEADGQSGPPR